MGGRGRRSGRVFLFRISGWDHELDRDNNSVATFVVGIGGLLFAKVGGMLSRFIDDLSEKRENFNLGDARLASRLLGDFFYVSCEEIASGLVIALSESSCFVQ